MISKNEERERRLAVTGRWFRKQESPKYLWTNWLFACALIIGLIAYIIGELM